MSDGRNAFDWVYHHVFPPSHSWEASVISSQILMIILASTFSLHSLFILEKLDHCSLPCLSSWQNKCCTQDAFHWPYLEEITFGFYRYNAYLSGIYLLKVPSSSISLFCGLHVHTFFYVFAFQNVKSMKHLVSYMETSLYKPLWIIYVKNEKSQVIYSNDNEPNKKCILIPIDLDSSGASYI
jgi:hypothetical protein